MPYGYQKITVDEFDAKQLFRTAMFHGITTFDTAPSYGQAEKWLGQELKEVECGCDVFTKTNGDRKELARSRKRLSEARDLTILHHNWTPKTKLITGVTGASIYAEDVSVDAASDQFRHVQVNWNILSQPNLYHSGGVTIIARSVFLQGALCGGKLPSNSLRPYVQFATQLANCFNISLKTLALRIALENPKIDRVIIAPTTSEELHECIKIARMDSINAGRFLPMLSARGDACTDPRTWAA